MKSLTHITTLSFAIIAASFASAAEKTEADSKLDNYQLEKFNVEVSNPIPSKIISPRLSESQIGHAVDMEFTVTAKGYTTDIKTVEAFPKAQDLAAAMKRVIKHWEFEPARNQDGIAVDVKMILPVKVVRSGENAGHYARIATAKPTVVALNQ